MFVRLTIALYLSVLTTGCGGTQAVGDSGPSDVAVEIFREPVPPTLCDTSSARNLSACVSEERYVASLTEAARVRPSGSAGWLAVQTQIARELTEAGFSPQLENYGTGSNIVATRVGSVLPSEWIVISAHYDSVANCDGADDNASGVAGILEAARILGMVTFDRSLVVALWDEEEAGLIGSEAFVSGWSARGLGDIRFAVSLEMIGYRNNAEGSQTLPTGFEFVFREASDFATSNGSRGDFIAMIHDTRLQSFATSFVASANHWGLRAVGIEVPDALLLSDWIANLRRSDHAPFWRQNISAAMVTDTANFRNPGYHCQGVPDSLGTIDTEFATLNTRAIVEATVLELGLSQ